MQNIHFRFIFNFFLIACIVWISNVKKCWHQDFAISELGFLKEFKELIGYAVPAINRTKTKYYFKRCLDNTRGKTRMSNLKYNLGTNSNFSIEFANRETMPQKWSTQDPRLVISESKNTAGLPWKFVSKYWTSTDIIIWKIEKAIF